MNPHIQALSRVRRLPPVLFALALMFCLQTSAAHGESPAALQLQIEQAATKAMAEDRGWSDEFALGVGCDGTIEAVTADGSGGYYVGGSFLSCGSIAARNIAHYDPQLRRWSALGEGLPDLIGMVMYRGELNVYSSGLRVWNGSAWRLSAEFDGACDFVTALAVHGDDIYLGGEFDTDCVLDSRGDNGVVIKRWDGATMHDLGHLGNPSGGGLIHSIAFVGDAMYVAGHLLIESGGSQLARWDGSQWHYLRADGGTGLTFGARSAHVLRLMSWRGELYATGDFTASAGPEPVEINRIARWDGNGWAPLGSGLDGYARALLATPDHLYVGGSFTSAGGLPAQCLARWDGAQWEGMNLSTSDDTTVNALLASDDGIIVAGRFTLVGDAASPKIVNNVAGISEGVWQRWDDALGGHGPNGPVAAIERFQGDLYIGGQFTAVGDVAARYLARWDGETWHPVGSADGNGVTGCVQALEATPLGLFVGGCFETINIDGDALTVNRLARWDGNGWHAVGDEDAPGVAGVVVSSLLWDDFHLYVAGAAQYEQAPPGFNANAVARWDGEVWSVLGDASANGVVGTVRAMAMFQGSLYVAGRLHEIDSAAQWREIHDIARWDGSAWHPVGNDAGIGLSSPDLYFDRGVYSLAVHDGALFAGGEFANANQGTSSETRVNNFARWDGERWHAVSESGAGGQGSVYGLASSGNRLFVAGYFPEIVSDEHSLPSRGIAEFVPGGQWSGFGSGLDGVGTTLFVEKNGVYVGGRFGAAGPHAASSFAHYRILIFESGFEAH